jgi:KDO2-lipid IV(A) lauroyltransferase
LREDVARISAALVARFEVLIRRAPAQWHMFQSNWPSDR